MVSGALLLSGTQMLRAQISTTTEANQGQRGQLSESDYRFLEKAARSGLEEVELGQLAQQKGTSQEVRSFGQRMVTDHTKLNNELKQIATQKGATLPAQMSHHENSTIQHLQNASGVDFDKTYAKDMVKDHQKDVKEFQSASQKLSDPDLKAFAQKSLTTLQEHLGMAENLETGSKSEK
jgi:putative membrane protein